MMIKSPSRQAASVPVYKSCIFFGVKAADLLSAVKSTGVIAKMVDKPEKFGYFNVAVCDAEEVKQDVEVNGTTRAITVTNSKMKLVTTDGVSLQPALFLY